jgi:hypothetical protein
VPDVQPSRVPHGKVEYHISVARRTRQTIKQPVDSHFARRNHHACEKVSYYWAGWHCFEIQLSAVALFCVLTKQCKATRHLRVTSLHSEYRVQCHELHTRIHLFQQCTVLPS